jgi:hypothetical protein
MQNPKGPSSAILKGAALLKKNIQHTVRRADQV